MNIFIKVLKVIVIDLIWEIIYFPIWWYTVGLYRAVSFCMRGVARRWHSLGLEIQFKFLFKPMYAQSDFTGRVISFLMRFSGLIFKFFAWLIVVIVFILIFALWIILPIIVLWQIKLNINFINQ